MRFRRFFTAVLVVCFTAPVFAAFDTTSVRQAGINTNLAGFLTDEYTDLMLLPADILNSTGWRIYTNLSNLGNGSKTDALFSGAGNTTYSLGIIGDPFKEALKYRAGFFYTSVASCSFPAFNLDADLTGTATAPDVAVTQGEISNIYITRTDAGGNGTLTDAGDSYRAYDLSARRRQDTATSDYTIIFGMPLAGINLGVNIAKVGTTTDYMDNWSSADTSFLYGTGNTRLEYGSQLARNSSSTNQLPITAGARKPFGEAFDLGVGVTFNPVTVENTTTNILTLWRDNAPGTPNTNTVNATVTDGLSLNGAGFTNWGMVAGDALLPTHECKNFNDDNDGASNEDIVDGLDNDNDGRIDEDPNGKLTNKTTISSIAFKPDIHLNLNKELKLIAKVNYTLNPGTISNKSESIIDITRTGDPSLGAGTIRKVYSNDMTTLTGDQTASSLSAGAGAEAKLANDVLLVGGLNVTLNGTKTSSTSTRVLTTSNFSDLNSNGVLDAGENKVFTSDTDGWNAINDVTTTQIMIPIGLELGVTKGLVIRMGGTHTVTKTKTVAQIDYTRNDQLKTSTQTTTGTVDVYGAAQSLSSKTTTSDTTTQATTFYYGAGYKWSDNLQIDILGCSNLTNLAAWRLGITLLF